MFDKKQNSCVKRIHLVTDNGLYDRKVFYTVKIVFYSSSMNDGEFINYCELNIFELLYFLKRAFSHLVAALIKSCRCWWL